MAFKPEPNGDQLKRSVAFTHTKITSPEGKEIGLDSRGQYEDKKMWRRFGVSQGGAEYENASQTDAVLFDKVLDSACIVYPPN